MRHSILLIEDDFELANELSVFLSQNDYQMTIAHSGYEANILLQKNNYSLFLVDVGLPDCSGFDLCRKIRLNSSTPIIMLTAHGEDNDIITGLEAGADDYVTKPYSLRVLLSRIKTQFRRMTRENLSDSGKLISGDLEIDLEHKTVSKRGNEIPISGTEFDLCRALVISNCQIMPRDMLLEKVWDFKGKYVDNNTLSVHVSRLRKKLGLFGNTPYIDTVKGIGYRWNIDVHTGK